MPPPLLHTLSPPRHAQLAAYLNPPPRPILPPPSPSPRLQFPSLVLACVCTHCSLMLHQAPCGAGIPQGPERSGNGGLGGVPPNSPLFSAEDAAKQNKNKGQEGQGEGGAILHVRLLTHYPAYLHAPVSLLHPALHLLLRSTSDESLLLLPFAFQKAQCTRRQSRRSRRWATPSPR